MSLALKCGACCVKICSLEGRLRGALPPSFFWRNQRPRVSVRGIASQPTQTQALGDERTHHKLHQADPKRLRGQVESGGTDGGGAVQNQVTLMSSIRFPQIRFQSKHSNLS